MKYNKAPKATRYDIRYTKMRPYIDNLAREGKVIEIGEAVSSKYEVASICAEHEQKGQPVLFHAVDAIVSHSTPRNPITFKAFYQKCSIIAPFDLFGVMYETMG